MTIMPKHFIIFQNGGVGDFLMALFLAGELRRNGALRVYIVLHRGAGFLQQFAESYPYVTVIEASLRRPRGLFEVARLFLKRNAVILPPTIGRFPLRVKLLARMLAGFGPLVGFQDNGALCGIYTKTLPYKLDQDFAESMRDVIRALGMKAASEPPRLLIDSDEGSLVRSGLSGKRYVVFHPRGSSERRRLSEAECVAIIECILQIAPELHVAVSGAESERAHVEGIMQRANNPRAVAVIGASPKGLAALIRGGELFVGMDTGITHLACFLDAKVLLIGKNATANWLPYYHPRAVVLYRLAEEDVVRKDRHYLLSRQQGRIRPFKDVPVAEVCAEVRAMLA